MDHDIELRFQNLKSHLEQSFGEYLDIHGVLFLIGVNELGHGHKKYSKQEKTDLIHIAICTLLVPYGYYEYKGRDEEGWPHFELIHNLPAISSKQQQHLIKEGVLDYFKTHDYHQ